MSDFDIFLVISTLVLHFAIAAVITMNGYDWAEHDRDWPR